MKLFGKTFSLKKKNAPTWRDLTTAQRESVTKKILALAGAKYTVVDGGMGESQRPRGIAEKTGEDGILNQYARGRLLDLTRNLCRNSSTFQTVLKQFDFNVVGTQGGKVIVNFPDGDLSKEITERFADYTRGMDYFDGLSFNLLLKLILKTSLIGGDCVLYYDDGAFGDSGKLLTFESDEIGNTTPEALKGHYGATATQSLGKVYNDHGRFVGVIVSRAQRGADVFDPAKSIFLKREPDDSVFDSPWFMPVNFWRVGQGRGVTQAASAVGVISDLESLVGYELAAAKANAQTFATISKNATGEEASVPLAFDASDLDGMSEDEIKAIAAQEATQTVSMEATRSAGILFQKMPDDYKMELLQTAHPNEKVADFVKWLCGRSSGVFGLSEAYATMTPTGADFRAQQLMTQPAFLEAQKYLEAICDWLFNRFVKRLIRRGEIDGAKLPPNWMQLVSWEWPQLDELDQVAHQNAVNLKLQNLTGSLRDELGPDWREKLAQIKDEIAFCKAAGLPHPAYRLLSGGEAFGAEVTSEET